MKNSQTLPAPLPRNPEPLYRELGVYAIDPALARRTATFEVANAVLKIRWNDLVGPGPEGKYIDVIDFDPSSGCFYTPADLSAPACLARKGIVATEADPRFHAQMVYAVAMHTIQTFEAALGRKILWSPRDFRKAKDPFVEKLRIYPHALRGENAYYDPERKALLFGYFPARDSGGQATGGLVFSALSFDIVAHETTHAILDGLHRRFVEDTNPDVLAFHEAFSDIVALFSHFGLPDFLRHQVAAARGDLDSNTMLAQIAVEFGQGVGKYGALRDAIGSYDENGNWRKSTPQDHPLRDRKEPHDRGSVLVAAVFDAFLSIYRRRTVDLMRIASDGTGIMAPGEINRDLVGRLADEAAKAARHVLNICIRALDYLPPIDITFLEYLRALLTADHDAAVEDPLGYRVAFVEAFEKWGIVPEDASPLGEASLRWQTLGDQIESTELGKSLGVWQARFHQTVLDGMDCYRRILGDKESIRSAVRKYPRFKKLREYAATMRRGDDDAVGSERKRVQLWSEDMAAILHGYFRDLRGRDARGRIGGKGAMPVDVPDPALDAFASMFGISPDTIELAGEKGKKGQRAFEVHSVRSLRRPSIDPLVLTRPELVIVLTQRMWVNRTSLGEAVEGTEEAKDMKFRGGSTIVYDLERGEFRYVIRKDINSQKRRARQRDYQSGNVRAMYFADSNQPFQLLHQGGC